MGSFYPYHVYFCENHDYYTNSKLVDNLDKIFSYSVVRTGTNYLGSEPRRNTTSGLPALDVFKIPGTQDLTNWITSCLLDSSTKFTGKSATGIQYVRNWINISYRGHFMDCHNHIAAGENTYVAIFYQSAPEENSSKFTFVKHATWNQPLKEINEQDREYIDVRSGMLLIHPSSAWHATTQHQTDQHRIAMIFDFEYEFN